jgi:hypothetical protein
MNETSFKDNMLEWNDLKESAKKFADGQKKIRDRIKELNDQNIKYMETEGVDEVNVDNFEITLRRTTRNVVDVKRSNLPEILTSFYMDVEKLSKSDAEVKVEKFSRFIEKNYSKSTESLSLIRTKKN